MCRLFLLFLQLTWILSINKFVDLFNMNHLPLLLLLNDADVYFYISDGVIIKSIWCIKSLYMRILFKNFLFFCRNLFIQLWYAWTSILWLSLFHSNRLFEKSMDFISFFLVAIFVIGSYNTLVNYININDSDTVGMFFLAGLMW